MINAYLADEGLPISVIVPLTKRRLGFFTNFSLPLIRANNPVEIIINDDDESAPKKRNDGFQRATQPFVFFCDDDILLPATYLSSLLTALNQEPDAAFAYTGYHGIVLNPETHPLGGNFRIIPTPFNTDSLRRKNYISTMSLIRREAFPGFDEGLARFQDWDLWLTIAKTGGKGILVQNATFFAYYLDAGITSRINNEEDARHIIRRKHELPA